MAENLNISADLEEDFFELLEGRLYSERLKEIRKKENISVETLMAIYALGEEFYNRFLMKEAEVIFTAYMALCPHDHRGPGSLASIYLEQGKFNKALEMLNIVKVYPTADFDETIL
ncbi:regulator, partial [Vibrio cholerae]|nr:regulator [Vibrio cholerae]